MKRHKTGQRLSHGDANRFEENYEWYRRFKARGEGGGPTSTPVNFSKVMAANYTGQQIYIGDVCEFDGNPFVDVDLAEQYPDPRNDRWLKAVVPNGERIGWGIALDPIGPATGDDREGGEFLTLGNCHAIVKIVNNDHWYAEREAGEQVLRSAAKGPVKILHKPTGGSLPERRLCFVQLMDEGGDAVDMIEVNDTGKSAGDLTYSTAERAYAHRSKIRRFTATGVTFEDAGDCWLLLTNEWGEVAGDVPAVNHQYYGPAKYVGVVDFDGEALPTYTYCRSELATEIIEVEHESVTDGDVVEDTDGYHPGRILRRAADGSYSDGGAVWLQFVTSFANYAAVAGQVLAVQGQWYGPARYSRTWDKVTVTGEGEEEVTTHDKRAVYVCESSERSFIGEFEDSISSGGTGTFNIFHSRTLADSGFTKEVTPWGSAVTAGKKGAIQFVAGRWFGSQTEC